MEIYTVSRDPVWVSRPLKERERNLVSSMFSIIVVAILAISLAQPRWFSLRGGGCSQTFLGVQPFFRDGAFRDVSVVKSPSPTALVYFIGGSTAALRDCVTPRLVALLRINIAVILLAILMTLVQLGLDLFGPENSKAKIFRRNALGSITTVILCVCSIGICYYCATLIEDQQEKTKINPGTKVKINFDISYYLVTGGGAVAVLAVAANLLKHHSSLSTSMSGGRSSSFSDQMEDHLLEDYDGAETFSIGNTHCQLWPCRTVTAARPSSTSTGITLGPTGPVSLPPPPYSP